MISILPEGTLALFSLVVLLSNSPSNELNRFRNYILASISYQEMDVLCDGVTQNDQAETLLCFKKPSNPFFTVSHELKQKLLLVTSVCDVPGIARNKITIRSWHIYGFLKRPILRAKWAS